MPLLPNIRSIDWKTLADPRISKEDVKSNIRKHLLGDMSFLGILRERPANANASDFDLTLAILRNWGRPTMKPDKWGQYWHQHFARYLEMLIPGTFIHPWLMDECWALEYCIANNLDILNLIGSKSSGKSAFIARATVGLVALEPKWTCFYIAAPYKTAAESTVWGEIRGCFLKMLEAHPSLFPNAKYRESDNICDFGLPFKKSAGFIELVSLDKVGKLQGIKAEDPDQERGYIGIGADEIGVFPHDKIIEIIANVTANANFICLTGCNFKDIGGVEGRFCQPEDGEYKDLSLEGDHFWRSQYNSFTIRLDGHWQPNVLCNKVIYGPLLREGKRADMERQHGLRGPKYLEQVRSFPNQSMSDYYVTTKDKIMACGGYDQLIPAGVTTKVAFCDPGFGGDPCKFMVLEFGSARVMGIGANMEGVQILRPAGPVETLKIDTQLVCDHEWVARVRRVTGGSLKNITLNIGHMVTPEQQIAVQCGELLARYGVDRRNFGYDGSMRASVVQEMMVILGPQVSGVDFGGSASNRTNALTKGREAKDLYVNAVTEFYFNFAEIVHSGSFRGAEIIPDAITQLCRRRWYESNKRKMIQPKVTKPGNPVKGYKQENQGKSPDDADTLVGGTEMALRRGFTPPLLRKPQGDTGRPWSPRDRILELARSSHASPVNQRGAAKLRSKHP
jgi:hypothetical protein